MKTEYITISFMYYKFINIYTERKIINFSNLVISHEQRN